MAGSPPFNGSGNFLVFRDMIDQLGAIKRERIVMLEPPAVMLGIRVAMQFQAGIYRGRRRLARSGVVLVHASVPPT